jgi:hypothetical protein
MSARRVGSVLLAAATFAAALIPACGGSEAPSATTACVPGQSVSCTGVGPCAGSQTCKGDGSGYDPCVCLNNDSGAPPDAQRSADGSGDGPWDATILKDAVSSKHESAEAEADTGARDTGTDTGPTCTGFIYPYGAGTGSTGIADGGDGGNCTATATAGALPLLSCGYMPSAASGGVANGGYAWAFADETLSPQGNSTSCLDPSAFCGAGTSAAPTGGASGYGGGIGVSLNQAMGKGTPQDTYSLTGTTGISYTLSNLPTGVRLIVGDLTGSGGTDYYINLTKASDTVPWSSFNCESTCTGELTGPPAAIHVEFEVPYNSPSVTWSFCVTALSFVK